MCWWISVEVTALCWKYTQETTLEAKEPDPAGMQGRAPITKSRPAFAKSYRLSFIGLK